MAVYYQRWTDYLDLEDTGSTNTIIINITDTLSMDDDSNDHYDTQSVYLVLSIAQALSYTLSGHKSITDTLAFNWSFTPGLIQQLYHNLTYTQSTSHDHSASTTLGFSQTVIGGRNYAVTDSSLVYTGTIKTQFVKDFPASDTLAFSNNVAFYKNTWQYIAGPVYPITKQAFVTFTSQSGLGSITLKAPDFGNKENISLRRIQRETRGGDLIIYRDPNWTKDEYFELTFSYIGYKLATEFQQFLNVTLGTLLTYLDFEGNSWTGIFNSPNLTINTPGRFNQSFTIKFEVIDDT